MAEMSAEARKNLTEFNAAQSDWYAVCPKCQAEVSGTLVELRAHKCKEVKNGT